MKSPIRTMNLYESNSRGEQKELLSNEAPNWQLSGCAGIVSSRFHKPDTKAGKYGGNFAIVWNSTASAREFAEALIDFCNRLDFQPNWPKETAQPQSPTE